MAGPSGRVLAVRLDSDGDVLLTGPAVRALAQTALGLDLLVCPAGRAAGQLLPGVDEVLVFDAPWSGYRPPAVNPAGIRALVSSIGDRAYDRAVIFTSFHQSPLPMALLARLAGIGYVAGTSVDYPGSLLDLRYQRPAGHEVTAALGLAHAAGGDLPPGDDGRLAIRRPLPPPPSVLPGSPFVVVHPGASVSARALRPDHAAAIVRELVAAGWAVVITGGPSESAAAAIAAGDSALNLAGLTSLPMLAAVLAKAACVVVGNTGPAHLAAAVGTPVVSLFSPVVPVERWAPFGVSSVILGDQNEACRDTRARDCPISGHPCLTSVPPASVVAAVHRLSGDRAAVMPA
jgi:heptosyltransferase-3